MKDCQHEVGRRPVFFSVLLALGVSLSGCLAASHASPEQPIAFPHEAHTNVQIDCSFCHSYYDDYAAAGLPETALCASCHSAMSQESPEAQKLIAYAESGEEIPWVRLYELDQFVYFSHKWHVRAGVECAECHGDIGESQRAVRHMVYKMDWCLDCHEANQASVDCVTCHK